MSITQVTEREMALQRELDVIKAGTHYLAVAELTKENVRLTAELKSLRDSGVELPEPFLGIGRLFGTADKRDAYTESQLRDYGRIKVKVYFKDTLERYGAAEYKRGTEALQVMTAERDELSKLLHQALDERDHYIKERDALKGDAERYRWLRNKARSIDWSYFVGVKSIPASIAYCSQCRSSGTGMDAAIDAAMKGTS